MGKARRKGKKGRGRRGDRVTGNLSMRDAVAVAAAQSNEESLLAQVRAICRCLGSMYCVLGAATKPCLRATRSTAGGAFFFFFFFWFRRF